MTSPLKRTLSGARPLSSRTRLRCVDDAPRPPSTSSAAGPEASLARPTLPTAAARALSTPPPSTASRPVAFVTFGLIVDDLVHADGSLALAQLGGGGPQTAFGALLHPSSPAVGLAASAGDDLPPGCAAWLRAAGVDTRGVLRTGAKPTPRAWQETGADGLRRQSWRSPPAEASDLYPPLSSLPPDYGRAVCYHAGVHPNRPGLERLASLRAAAAAAASARAGGCAGGLLSVETYTGADAPLGARELALLCCAGHVFSPNEAEARSLLEGGVLPGGGRARRPPPPAAALLAALCDAGAAVAALRRGPAGALLRRAGGSSPSSPSAPDEAVLVPAFHACEPPGADPTGCGNAFCGAFCAALAAGDGLALAGCWGAAAASLVLEAVGLPAAPPGRLRAEAARRVALLLARCEAM